MYLFCCSITMFSMLNSFLSFHPQTFQSMALFQQGTNITKYVICHFTQNDDGSTILLILVQEQHSLTTQHLLLASFCYYHFSIQNDKCYPAPFHFPQRCPPLSILVHLFLISSPKLDPYQSFHPSLIPFLLSPPYFQLILVSPINNVCYQ